MLNFSKAALADKLFGAASGAPVARRAIYEQQPGGLSAARAVGSRVTAGTAAGPTIEVFDKPI